MWDFSHISPLGEHIDWYVAIILLDSLNQLNENLENQSINVRVGQAVDTVGQAGKPKKITGFQTHTSPVVINYGERYITYLQPSYYSS